MRFPLRATLFALVLSGVAGIAQAQSSAPGATIKIAFVNTQSLMEAAPGRAAAESLLSKEGEGYRTQLQKMQDSLQSMVTKFQKQEPTMTAAAKTKMQDQMQSYQTEMQAANLKFQQQFAARQSEVMAPVTDAVKKVIDDIRVEDGYSMILANDPQTSTIVSADKNLDITDRVVSRLRATAKPALPAAAAAKPGAPNAPAGVTRPKPPAE
ncbi:MAG TPA: OmpH family outer membrane protein [Gemmatimonadaceae bacterium]